MIRNYDFFKSAIAYIAISICVAAAAFFRFGGRVGAYVLGVCAVFCAAHLIITKRRYGKIAALSAEIDGILHGAGRLDMTEGTEGELAVLRSEIYKMTLRLREQADVLRADKVFLSNAMADVSHQLRTPLTSLNLAVTLLKNPSLDTERRAELLREVSKSINRLDWLISAMLNMAKIDAGTAIFKKERVSLREVIDRAYAPLEIAMELKNQEFILEMTGDESFMGDLDWTVEAVGNVLKNAMEHTQEGGRIQIVCTENPLFSSVTVSDNGPGISPEDLPNLFRRFYRGSGSPEGSVGVGLALAQMIVTEQNGSLQAENSRYGGARFQMRFYKTTV